MRHLISTPKRATRRFSRKLASSAVLICVVTLLVVGVAPTPLHASVPGFQPADLTPQGPFSPWFGSVTSDVVLSKQSGQPPTVYQDPANDNVNSGNRAKVYMAIRAGIRNFAEKCVFGPPDTVGPLGCDSAQAVNQWPTQLCEEIFQGIRDQNLIVPKFALAMENAVSCGHPVDGRLTAARVGQCLDFEYLVDPNTVKWNELVKVRVGTKLTSHYLFTANFQLDLRFELCNSGNVDASDSNSSPLTVDPYYNPDHLPDCLVPDGSGGYRKLCGITVTFRNVSVSHRKTAGTVDWIKLIGNAKADQKIADGFTNQRKALDPATLADVLTTQNAEIRAGAQKVVDLLGTDPRFTVVFSLNDNVAAAPAAPVGPFYSEFGLETLLPGGLNVELRQEQFALLEVAGFSGCNGVHAASVRVVGRNFLPNHVGLFSVHNASRSVPNVGGAFNTDASGVFDTGDLPISAQTGDRIEVLAGDGTRTATGVLDPISECIP
jgi:hypothetical protein